MDDTTLSAEDVVRDFLDDLSRRWVCAARSDLALAARDFVDELRRKGFVIVALKPPAWWRKAGRKPALAPRLVSFG
jgi:hypothetical protein